MSSHEGKMTRRGARRVVGRLENLREAIEAGGAYMDPFVVARAREELRAAQERMNAGLGLTVAALAGGTGSGKSSLFNALSGLNFAEVGELRPTTREVSACAWSDEADQILDLLGVNPSRRIRHSSILTPEDGAFESLILLDLPDHDSVEQSHSVVVSAILPKVDLLLWVLDPQKYADHLIHSSYLEAMTARADHMVVLLNQIDRVPGVGKDELLADARRLLDADGLEGVPLYGISALDKTSLEPVREELARAVSSTNSATATAIAELDAIRARLATGVGMREADMEPLVVQACTDLVEASAIPAVADSVREAGKKLTAVVYAKPELPAQTLVTATCDSWVSRACTDLPPLWRQGVNEVLPERETLRREVGERVRAVEVPRVARGFVLGVGVLCIATLVLLIVGFLMSHSSLRIWAGVGFLVSLVVGARAIRARRIRGEAAAQAYRAQAEAAVVGTIEDLLVKPTAEILEKHARTRRVLVRESEA